MFNNEMMLMGGAKKKSPYTHRITVGESFQIFGTIYGYDTSGDTIVGSIAPQEFNDNTAGVVSIDILRSTYVPISTKKHTVGFSTNPELNLQNVYIIRLDSFKGVFLDRYNYRPIP